METNHTRTKRKKPLTLNWDQLLPNDSTDDEEEDHHLPQLIIKPNQETPNNQTADIELRMKPDQELTDNILRLRKTLQTMGGKLVDKGAKIKDNLLRHECEFERRNQEKARKGREEKENIQLSGQSGDSKSASHEKNKSGSMFAKVFNKKMDEDKDSRTAYSFEKHLSYIKPCKGPKLTKSQILSMGRSPKRSSANIKEHIISDDDDDNNDGDATTSSFCRPNSPQDPPSRNLRPRPGRAYHLVDKEPPEQRFMGKLDPCFKDVEVYYPSRGERGAVFVNYDDMACLAPRKYISSGIMDFYIRYLQQPSSLSESAACNYHFFNTYFYNKLRKLSYEEDSFHNLRKWWKGVNLFEKSYILLPIHENDHWSLVIICIPDKDEEMGPVLLHLDSLGFHDSISLFHNINRFLKEEWSYLKKSESSANLPVLDEIWEDVDSMVDYRTVTVPQQKNGYDCGLFVLSYMGHFIKEAPVRFKKNDLAMFSGKWFQPREASNLRTKIFKLLMEEFKKAKDS